jgi:hypothetical protein
VKQIDVSKLVINRSVLTRAFRMAGLPVSQMYTHLPAVESWLDRPKSFHRDFKTLAYNNIQESPIGSTGGHQTSQKFGALVEDVQKQGIQEPLTGWALDNERTVEIHGGHHRAVIAYALGKKVVPVRLKPFRVFDTMSPKLLQSIRKVYERVPATESLRKGWSYNPFPGMTCHRSDPWRLEAVYADIISCSGNQLVDLGCNDGYFGSTLSVHDFEVTFVDTSDAYLNVVRATMKALGLDRPVLRMNVDGVMAGRSWYDVTLYTDVFYHTVLTKGTNHALKQLSNVIDRTQERLIFSPGRWDKLNRAGCTQSKVFEVLQRKAKQIRYLGRDKDRNYGREIYSAYY